MIKESACNAGDPGWISGSGKSPGEGNGNPLRILAWRIPGTEDPGGLQSMGSESQTQLKQLSSSSRVDLQYCLFLVFMKSYKVNILMPTLQMLNQRCREVTSLAQGHIQ